MEISPSLLALVPSVVGVVAAVRSAVPSVDGRARVILVAVVVALASVLLVFAPLSPWLAAARDALILGSAAFGTVTVADRLSGFGGTVTGEVLSTLPPVLVPAPPSSVVLPPPG